MFGRCSLVHVGLTGRGESKYEADLLVNVLTGYSIQTITTLKYINRSGHVHIQLPLKPQYYSTLLYTHSHTLFRMIMHCTVCQQKKAIRNWNTKRVAVFTLHQLVFTSERSLFQFNLF